MRRKVLHLSTIINVSPFPTPINLIPKSRFPLTGLAQVPLFKRFTQRFKRDCYVFRRRGRWLVLLLPNNSLSMIRGPYIKEWTHSFLSNDHRIYCISNWPMANCTLQANVCQESSMEAPVGCCFVNASLCWFLSSAWFIATGYSPIHQCGIPMRPWEETKNFPGGNHESRSQGRAEDRVGHTSRSSAGSW